MLRFIVRMVTVPLSNTLMAAPFRVLAALSLAALGCRGADAARHESTSSPASSSSATPATAASARSPNAALNDSVSAHADSGRIRGNRSQNVLWIVEASDFQCPYCAAAIHRLDDLLAKHPQDIRLIFKQFPLDIHSDAALAAEAALAAHAQGKFWPMHDKLYANFRSISREKIFELAKEIGLDQTRFAADLNSGKYKLAVQKELAEGERAGVAGTPTLFVNGKHFNGPVEVPILEQIVQTELKSVTSTAKALPRSQ